MRAYVVEGPNGASTMLRVWCWPLHVEGTLRRVWVWQLLEEKSGGPVPRRFPLRLGELVIVEGRILEISGASELVLLVDAT